MLLGASVAILGNPFSSCAAVANVLVGSGGNFFVPAVTNINVNDQVIWTWVGNNHNTTNLSALWGSGTHNTGFLYTNRFTVAGSFPYECSIHVGLGMTGSIVVSAVNLPPSVSITNPAAGAVFAVPANVAMQVSASDSDGTVTNVQFLVDANILTNRASGPFTAVTNNLAAGSHTLRAVASDNGGAKATNSIAISVVAPATVLLSAQQTLPPGAFRFTYSANSGLNYVVESSTNLFSAWNPLVTNQAAGSSVNYTDVNATFGSGFYRVGRLPNP